MRSPSLLSVAVVRSDRPFQIFALQLQCDRLYNKGRYMVMPTTV
ncbi:MAG: hypothetical protein V7K56_32450 [Nostoc sp.]